MNRFRGKVHFRENILCMTRSCKIGKHLTYLGNVCLDVGKARESVGEDYGQAVMVA